MGSWLQFRALVTKQSVLWLTRNSLVSRCYLHCRLVVFFSHPNSALLIMISAFQALINENHGHLVALGVSHPSLEIIRAKTAAPPHGLSTKLTGAGGGGCAVTLVPDGKLREF